MELEFERALANWSGRIASLARREGYPHRDALVGRTPLPWHRHSYAFSSRLCCRHTPYQGYLPLAGPSLPWKMEPLQADPPDLEYSRADLTLSYLELRG